MVYSTAGTTIILSSTTFFLGCLLINFIVDHGTLWTSSPPSSAFDNAILYYSLFSHIPPIVLGVAWTVFILGIAGHVMKLHRGNQSNTLFDGASLVLYLISFILVFSNLVKGVNSVAAQRWEMSKEDTIRVIAASNVIIAAALLGVGMLQVGQGYAERAAEVEMAHLKKE